MRAQIEGGLHDATLDKSPGAGLAWATAWNGYNLARLHREAWPNPAWMEQVDNTVYERYNPVPLWTAYPYQTYWVPPPDSPAPQRQPHPSARAKALLLAIRDASLKSQGVQP